MFDWCSTGEGADLNNRCLIRANGTCEGDSVIEFIFPDQVNTTYYEIVFNNSNLNCLTTNFSIRNTLDSGDLRIKSLNVTFFASVIWFRDISIDTGAVTSDTGQGSVTIGSVSVLKTDTSSNNWYLRENQRAFFTGNCFVDDEYSDTALNNIWTNSYGQVIIPGGYSPLTAPRDELNNNSFFGTGSNNTKNAYGGGRIFIRSDLLVIEEIASYISSSACQEATEANQVYGTGGTIIFALGNFSFPQKSSYLIKVRGASSTTISGKYFGGGGRFYAEVRDQVDKSVLVGYVDAGVNDVSTVDQKYFGQVGTAYLQNSSRGTIYYYNNAKIIQKYTSFNCYTILNSSNIWPKPGLRLRIKAVGTGKLIYMNNYNQNINASFDLPDIELSGNSTLYLISSTFSSSDSETAVSPRVTFNSRNIEVSAANFIPINNIVFNLSEKFVLTSKGFLQFPTINYPNQPSPFLYLTIDSPNIQIDLGSTINFMDSSTKRNTSSSLVLRPTGNFICRDSTIVSDRTFIIFSNDSFQNTTNVNFKSSENYCPSLDQGQASDAKLPHSYLRSHFSKKKMTTEERKAYLLEVSTNLTYLAPSEYKSAFVMMGTNVSLIQTNLSEVGYVGISVTENLRIDRLTNIMVNASGCAPTVLPIQSTSSKYLKICKVIGGSNVGRGTLGAQKNFENCKYVLSSSKNTIPIDSIRPGLGGQKNHQMESDKSGFGGGVVSIWAGKLATNGNFNSDGGTYSERDYTMIAGGSGGTVAFTADAMELGGTVSCKGGLGSAEVAFDHISSEEEVEESCCLIAPTGRPIAGASRTRVSSPTCKAETRWCLHQGRSTMSRCAWSNSSATFYLTEVNVSLS